MKVSGIFLKPAKCFLVVSVAELSDDLVAAIKNWLLKSIPEWSEFNIASAAKYLGVYLGRDGAQLTFEQPITKYFERVEELAQSNAPSLPTLLKYNQWVASVNTYVSQVTPIPDCALAGIGQRGVHKSLKLPPNSISRDLLHSFDDFCACTPIALVSLCRASMYRFARSEFAFISETHSRLTDLLGDHISLEGAALCRIPDGGVGAAPLIENLLDAVYLRGDFAVYKSLIDSSPDHAWLSSPLTPVPH